MEDLDGRSDCAKRGLCQVFGDPRGPEEKGAIVFRLE